MGARSTRSWVLSATQRRQFVPRLTPRDVMGSKALFLLRPTGFEGQDRSRHWEEEWSAGVME
jgi:hypothetical protein